MRQQLFRVLANAVARAIVIVMTVMAAAASVLNRSVRLPDCSADAQRYESKARLPVRALRQALYSVVAISL